jgi:hypothetical protein
MALRSRLREALQACSHSKVQRPPQVLEQSSWYPAGSLAWKQLTLDSTDGRPEGRIPVSLCAPLSPSSLGEEASAVIQLHALGQSRHQVKHRLQQYAHAGILGVSFDARFHGGRVDLDNQLCWNSLNGYANALSRAWDTKDTSIRPFLMSSALDALQVASWLKSESSCNTIGTTIVRVGMGGISLGGMVTTLAASADDFIGFAAPEIGVQSFSYALDNGMYKPRADSLPGNVFQTAIREVDGSEGELSAHVAEKVYDVISPGLVREFDGPSVLPLIANSKPLLVLSGSEDPRCPLPGVKECAASARDAFAKSSTTQPPPRFLVEEGVGHKCTEKMESTAQRWLIKVARGELNEADAEVTELSSHGTFQLI